MLNETKTKCKAAGKSAGFNVVVVVVLFTVILSINTFMMNTVLNVKSDWNAWLTL